jgi:hypothetical protein
VCSYLAFEDNGSREGTHFVAVNRFEVLGGGVTISARGRLWTVLGYVLVGIAP